MSSALAKVTENILRQLESGESLPWRKPWHVPSPMNLGGRKYSGVNRVVLSCAHFRDNRWATFAEIKRRGGNIRRGEKGTPIVFWQKRAIESDDEQSPKTALISNSYVVFNLEQCENLNAEDIPTPSLFDAEIEEALNATIRGFESCPPIKFGGNRACYYPKHDTVQMPHQHHFESPSAYASTMLHELAHATGHPSRLHRFEADTPIDKSGECLALEELTAELSSSMICSELGIIDQGNQNAAYIQSWIREIREKKNFLLKASSLAEKSANLILGRQS